MDKKPLIRHKALQPLSRQHHFGLLFSWKLRKGFSKNISIERLQNFAKWFFEKEIKPHFEAEEKYVFPILNADDPMIVRALSEHLEIRELFQNDDNPALALTLLEDKLEKHIRFEERELFAAIQSVATEAQLKKIEEIHIIEIVNIYEDAFWES